MRFRSEHQLKYFVSKLDRIHIQYIGRSESEISKTKRNNLKIQRVSELLCVAIVVLVGKHPGVRFEKVCPKFVQIEHRFLTILSDLKTVQKH